MARERPKEPVPVERPTAAPAQTPAYAPKGNALIEFSTEAQEDPNEKVTFGDSPVHCNCPHCERAVVTFIDYESSWVTYLLGFVVWFSLGWMAFWVLPLLWPAFKDVVHHCPRCLNAIARKSRISLPTFRSEVMTLKIGSCAVVLARKYVVILAGVTVLIVTAYIMRSTVHFSPGQASRETMPKGEPSMLTWEDFLHECGPRTSLGHRTSALRNFEEHFRKRTFTWQGEVLLIREGFDVFFLHAKSVVMVRMYPTRYPRRDMPDIALLFSEDRNEEVAPLNKGDWIEFEATMTAHGHRGDPEVMSLWHIKQVSKPSLLSSSGDAGSRGNVPGGGMAVPIWEAQAVGSDQAFQAAAEAMVKAAAEAVEKEAIAAEKPAPAVVETPAPAPAATPAPTPAPAAETPSPAPAVVETQAPAAAETAAPAAAETAAPAAAEKAATAAAETPAPVAAETPAPVAAETPAPAAAATPAPASSEPAVAVADKASEAPAVAPETTIAA